jgi:putative flippase GtrA
MILNHSQSFIRFCLVGLANTGVDLAVFLVLFYRLDMPLLAAHWGAFFVATCSSYFLNKRWSFERREPATAAEIVKFGSVLFAGLMVTSAVVKALAAFMPAVFAKILTIGVSAAWNYTGLRFLVFKKGS